MSREQAPVCAPAEAVRARWASAAPGGLHRDLSMRAMCPACDARRRAPSVASPAMATESPARVRQSRGPAAGFLAAGASGARRTHPLATIPLTQLFYLIGLAPAVLLLAPLMERHLPDDAPQGVQIVLSTLLVPVQFAFPYLVLWAWLRWFERRPFGSTGLAPWRRAPGGLAAGTGWALAFICGWIGAALAAGSAHIDRVLDFGEGGAAGTVLVGLLVLAMRVVMIGIEEQLFRGWMLQAVGVRWGRTAGVLLSSAFFSLFHFFFIGSLLLPGGTPHEPHWILMLNIFIWGVFAALVTLCAGNLWAAIGFHAAALILPGFLLTVAADGAGSAWPATESAFGLVVVAIDAPSHAAGGAGFAGLFEGLPATAALAVLTVLAWLRLRAADRRAA